MQSSELCVGVIKKTAAHGKFWGFITVFSQPLYEDVFFHFSSLDPSVTSLCVGDECSFHLVQSEKRETGKGVMAENIMILPKGTLKIANLRPEVYVGVIVEELREPKPGEEPRGGMVQVTKFKKPMQRNHGRMAKIGETFAFSGRDLHKGLIGPQLHQILRKGDEIEFQLYDCLVPRNVDRELRATRVCLEKLAGKRYYGTIDRIPQSRHNSSDQGDRAFGWIKFVEAGKEEIHFRFDRILSNEPPEVGDEVEFAIEYDHMKRPGASRIMFVPKGTCASLLDTHICEGTVTDGPRLHVLDSDRKEGHMDRDINHFLGGKIEFLNPAGGHMLCSLPCFLPSKFSPQSSYGRPPSPRLLKGDKVVFNLNVLKQDPTKQYISDIAVTVPTFANRLVGMVSHFTHPPVNSFHNKKSRLPKTGIIKVPEPQTPEEVFFHMNECEHPEEIRDRTEVEFDVAYNSKERPVAIRIRKKPKNFLMKFKRLHINVESKVHAGEAHQHKSRQKRYYVSNHISKKQHEIHSHNMEPSSPFDCLQNGVEVIFDVYRDLFARCDVLKNVRFKNKDIIRSRKRKVATRVESNADRFPRPRRKPKYNKAKDEEGLTSEDGAESSESTNRQTNSSRSKRKGKNDSKSLNTDRPKEAATDASKKGKKASKNTPRGKRTPKKPPLPQGNSNRKRSRTNSKSINSKSSKSTSDRRSSQPKAPTMIKSYSEPRRRGGKRNNSRTVETTRPTGSISRFPKSSRGRSYRRGRGRGSRNSGLQERRKNSGKDAASEKPKKEESKKEAKV